MNKEYLQNLAESEQREITEASKNGVLIDLISERALEIVRDDNNAIEKIVFSIGGPNVWIDFKDHPGFVKAAYAYEEAKSGIPWKEWDNIQLELEGW